ncbi:nitrate- and nitrite sensing domain-containing protein [Plantactinospora sp. GCM10030261]|uniref:sensor histidine kinase n=1 Tax=Plantactinospora sp. GCM10030261 TaxID=3273420 RepID=UPI0036215302
MSADWARRDRPNHRRRLDGRVVPHRRRSVWRVRDWRIRSKLIAVLIIPSVAFLVLAGVQTGALFGEASALDQFARQVGVGPQITGVLDAVQRERDRTAGELAGMAVPDDRSASGPDREPRSRTTPDQARSALRSYYAESDAAVARLRAAAQPLASSDASWRISYARAEDALAQLTDARAAVPAGVLNPNTVLGSYGRAIEALLSLLTEPSPGVDQPALTDAVLRYGQLARIQDITSQVRAQLYTAARAGRYGPDDLVRLADLRSQQFAALAEFRVAATREQVQRYERASARPEMAAATTLEESTISGSGRDPVVLDPEQWWTASGQRLDLLREVQASVLDDAIRQADQASAGQLRRTLLVAGVVLAVLLVAVLTSVLVGRSLASSLHNLRRQAIQVAQIELPDALERLRQPGTGRADVDVSPAVIRSLDEIGEVAEAFVAVHRNAVHLAVEQAQLRRNVNAMFVNLARRSQVLVERQLELLDELEREESDPDQLDNLFKLDHLAARMRRNDDSLLVLAGTESTRRWSQPVALQAVMLAAVAEVEQYQRIRHRVDGRVYVVGHVVADLVHLFAELLENATAFSPPDTTVQIVGRVDGSGEAAVEIVDDGLGMTEAALDEANEMLATPPMADVAASQRMGLFVVSHLAARQGVQVRLRTIDSGVVATVRLPAAVLAEPPGDDAPAPPTRRMIVALTGDGRPVSAVPATALAGSNGPGGPVAGRAVAALPAGSGGPAVPVPAVPAPAVPPAVVPAVPDPAAPVIAGAATPTTFAATPSKPAAGGGWFTRSSGPPTNGSPTNGGTANGTAPGPPAGRVGAAASTAPAMNDRGLPVRVPMAHLPSADEATKPKRPPEPDPDAVGGMLSRLYGGLRRAEEEETIEVGGAVQRPDGEDGT